MEYDLCRATFVGHIVRRENRLGRSRPDFLFAQLALVACQDQARPRVATGGVHPETTVYRDTVPACAECGVQVEPLASMGSHSDSVLLLDMPLIERDSRGRYYAPAQQGGSQVLMYDEFGKLARVVGRQGLGPGEFRNVITIHIGTDDSLFVLHDRSLTVLDSSGRVQRTVKFDKPWSLSMPEVVAVVPEGIIITAFLDRTRPDSVVLPLQLYNNRGEFVRSFGPLGLEGEHARSRNVAYGRRDFARASDGSIWLADRGFRFERVNMDGRVTRVIGVQTPPSWDLPLAMSMDELLENARRARARTLQQPPVRIDASADEWRPQVRPRTVRRDMGIKGDSLLVFITHDAVPNWRDVVGIVDKSKGDEDHVMLYPGYLERKYDTVIDIVDTRSGDLLARRRFPGMLMLTSDGTAYRRSVNAQGTIVVETFSISLSREP